MAEVAQVAHDEQRGLIPANPERVLQVHLAEYQALMARNTSAEQWIWAMIPAALIFAGLMANLWNVLDRRFVIWGIPLGLQTAFLLTNLLRGCIYSNIVYIETELRSRVASVLGPAGADGVHWWGYELFVAGNGGYRGPIWDFFPLLALLLTLVTIVRVVGALSLWDWIGLILNSMFWIYLVFQVYVSTRLRSQWTRRLKELLIADRSSD